MATIPQVPTSTRRIGVIPQVRTYNSNWGEIGREAASALNAIPHAISAYQGAKDQILRTNYHLSQRQKAERDRAQAEQEREERRQRMLQEEAERKANADARDIWGALDDQYVSEWNGTMKQNPDGTYVQVPGVTSLTPDQLRTMKKTVPQLQGELFDKLKKNKLYTDATPEVREKVDQLMVKNRGRYVNSAMAFQAKITEQENKERDARIVERTDRNLAKMYTSGEDAFSAENNYASMQKVAMLPRWRSMIENPDVLDAPTKADGSMVEFSDIKLKGITDPNDPAYKALKEDYDKFMLAHQVKRITSLTKDAAADITSGDGSTPADKVAQARGAVEYLQAKNMVNPDESGKLMSLVDNAELQMKDTRSKKQTQEAKLLDDELTKIQYGLAPITSADGSTFDTSKTFAMQFDEEGYKKSLDQKVANGEITTDHAQSLLARYQRMHSWQLDLQQKISDMDKQKLANGKFQGTYGLQQDGTIVYPPKSEPNTYVRLMKTVLEAEKNGVSSEALLADIDAASRMGYLSSQNYMSLWKDAVGKRDNERARDKLMVISSFFDVSQINAKDALGEPGKRRDAALEILKGNREYEQSGRIYDPDFTVDDVESTLTFVEDYLTKHPGDTEGAKSVLEGMIAPKRDAALARSWQERMMLQRQEMTRRAKQDPVVMSLQAPANAEATQANTNLWDYVVGPQTDKPKADEPEQKQAEAPAEEKRPGPFVENLPKRYSDDDDMNELLSAPDKK